MRRPQSGVEGLERRIADLEEQVSRANVLLGISSTSGARDAAGGGLGAGFNFDGEMIGVVTGSVQPVDNDGWDGVDVPIQWSEVKSDYGISFDDARLQMPSDGLFMVFLRSEEVWPRRNDRAGNNGTVFSAIEGGNMAGAMLFAVNQVSGLNVSRPEGSVVGGTFLGYGNAISFALTASYGTDNGHVFPTRIDVTAEVHRILEG